MYDYHSDEPSLMVASHYPTQEEQAHFLKAYAKHANPKNLQQEVSAWTMACHLTWALWGFVQANQSEIDFDYFFYAIQRVQAFRKCLEEKKNAF
jgi:thiamine kinase-like enzyme